MQAHWLARPATLRLLWIALYLVLALTVLAEFVFPVEAHFGIDGSFGFNAWFGFAVCAAMILLAKLLGVWLKRRDTYYDD